MNSPHRNNIESTDEYVDAELETEGGTDVTGSSVEFSDGDSNSKEYIDDLAYEMSRQHIDSPNGRSKSPLHNGVHLTFANDTLQPNYEDVDRSHSFHHETDPATTQFQLDLSVASNSDHDKEIISPQRSVEKLVISTSQEEKEIKMKTYQHVQRELGKQRILHENELKKMTQLHSEEIDEIFNQLNQVEVEFQDQLGSLESQLSKKNVMLEALGDQLSDIRKVNVKLKKENNETKEQNLQLQESLDIANGAVKELRQSIVNIENEFNDILESEKEEHRMEIQRVQNEIAKQAERQFAEANDCYVTLKKDFDTLLDERKEMDSEIELLKKRIENDERRRKSDEASLFAEIAQLKAELASSSAEVANDRKEFTAEMEGMSQRESMLRLQLKEVKAGYESSKMSLSSTIEDNEKLRRENRELQTVCEELMTLVEGNPSD